MANPYRGEVALMLAGRHYTLRPSFHSLCEIENRTGRSIFEWLAALCGKGLRMCDLALLLPLAGADALTEQEIKQLPGDQRQAALDALAHFLKDGLLLRQLALQQMLAGRLPEPGTVAPTRTELNALINRFPDQP